MNIVNQIVHTVSYKFTHLKNIKYTNYTHLTQR